MKILRLMTLVMFSVVLFSCGKDDDGNTDGGGGDTFWEATIDGQKFRAEGTTAYAVRFDIDNTISIYGSEEVSADGYSIYFISTEDEGKIGTYDLSKDGLAVGSVTDTGTGSSFITALEEGNGAMEITKLDDQSVEGTFSYTAYDGNGGSVKIEDGSFKVNFN